MNADSVYTVNIVEGFQYLLTLTYKLQSITRFIRKNTCFKHIMNIYLFVEVYVEKLPAVSVVGPPTVFCSRNQHVWIWTCHFSRKNLGIVIF